MKIIYGHPETEFIRLTVNAIINCQAAIKQLESEGLSFDTNYNLWQSYKKDLNTYKNDLKQTIANGYYLPYQDDTAKVDLMKYANSGLSYGIGIEGENLRFYLCESPQLAAVIKRIISVHDTPEEMQNAFYIERSKNQTH